MTICELLKNRKYPLLSFEFFPPKDDRGMEALKQAAGQLLSTHPDFVTVTYGAGGSTRVRTLMVCDVLRDMGFQVVMPHLTCVNSTAEELGAVADQLYEKGYRNIMALRGDPPKGETSFRPVEHGLAHASELIALLKKRHPDFCVGGAGYPEKHPEAASLEEDIAHLRAKVDAGAEFITTQMFFENQFYYDFVRRCREAGINRPVIPGLMPALSYKQVLKMTELCQAKFPEELERKLKVAGEGEVAEGIGIHWVIKQIEELLACNVPGLHLYILNRARSALSPGLINCLRNWRI